VCTIGFAVITAVDFQLQCNTLRVERIFGYSVASVFMIEKLVKQETRMTLVAIFRLLVAGLNLRP
jgi:hypothetical protein